MNDRPDSQISDQHSRLEIGLNYQSDLLIKLVEKLNPVLRENNENYPSDEVQEQMRCPLAENIQMLVNKQSFHINKLENIINRIEL